MKRFSEQFNTKAKTVRMSAAEKRDLRERLVSYIEYHPLAAAGRERNIPNFENAPLMSNGLVPVGTKRFLQWSVSFACILIFSVSYMAERAIPGDALYAIKVGFNEELRSTLARGSYEKVVWETERLNRRIAEARLLADEGRLTEEVEAQVASAVKEHSDNARKEIEALKLSDRDEATLASIELTTALDVQTTSLRNRSNAEPMAQSTDLIEDVLAASQAAELVSEEDSLPAYDRLLAKVESETTRAYELLKGVTKSATLEERTDIERRLQDIERKIGAAMSTAEPDDVSAREGLISVLQQTHRLIVFMTNIDVRSSLTVNEIVPVTLTEEERLTAVKKQTAETKSLLILVEEALSASSSDLIEADVLGKVSPAVEEITLMQEQTILLLTEEPLPIDALEALSKDAFNLISDTASLLQIKATQIVPVNVEDPTEEPEVVSPEVEEVINEVGTTSTSSVEVTLPETEAVVEPRV